MPIIVSAEVDTKKIIKYPIRFVSNKFKISRKYNVFLLSFFVHNHIINIKIMKKAGITVLYESV
jgi:hypothetical protein